MMSPIKDVALLDNIGSGAADRVKKVVRVPFSRFTINGRVRRRPHAFRKMPAFERAKSNKGHRVMLLHMAETWERICAEPSQQEH
jgi:hypothetical protein